MPRNRKSVQGGGAAVALGRDQDEVQELLDRLAESVTAGDARTIAKMWAAPAFVLGDMMVKPIESLAEVEHFFSGAREQYHAKGIADTRAEIVDLRWPTGQIAIVEVRWPWYDYEGLERGDEVSTYVLRRSDSGKLKIQAVIMHGTAGDL